VAEMMLPLFAATDPAVAAIVARSWSDRPSALEVRLAPHIPQPLAPLLSDPLLILSAHGDLGASARLLPPAEGKTREK